MKPSYRQITYYSTLIMLTSIIVLTFCFSEDPIETFVVNYWWLLASVGIMMAVSGVIFLVYEACQRLSEEEVKEWLSMICKTHYIGSSGNFEDGGWVELNFTNPTPAEEKEMVLHLYVDSLEDEWGPVLDALAREGEE